MIALTLIASSVAPAALANDTEPSETGSNNDSSSESSDDDIGLREIPVLPEPAQDVDDILQEREDNDEASAADESYPEVPGCAPLEGDREALPLVDRAHRAVSARLCASADQLDKTAGNGGAALNNDQDGEASEADPDRPPESEVQPDASTSTTLLRLNLNAEFRRHETPRPGAGISASIRLPLAYQRLQVFAREQSEAMQVDDTIDEAPAGLLWVVQPAAFLISRTDIGLSGIYPFVRIRLPISREYDTGFSWRLRPETYWRWQDGPGVANEGRLQYPYHADNRWVYHNRIELNAALETAGTGAAWSQRLTYRHQLQDRFTVTGRVAQRGRTEPHWQTDSVRSDLRLRRSIGRPWFYAEAEPYTEWLREDDFAATPGIILRMEILLGDYDLYDS